MASGGVFTYSGQTDGNPPLTRELPDRYSGYEGQCTLGFRPENTGLKIGEEGGKFNIAGFESLGSETVVHLDHGELRISAVWHRPGPEANHQITDRKTSVKVVVEEPDIRLFDENGIAVRL